MATVGLRWFGSTFLTFKSFRFLGYGFVPFKEFWIDWFYLPHLRGPLDRLVQASSPSRKVGLIGSASPSRSVGYYGSIFLTFMKTSLDRADSLPSAAALELLMLFLLSLLLVLPSSLLPFVSMVYVVSCAPDSLADLYNRKNCTYCLQGGTIFSESEKTDLTH